MLRWAMCRWLVLWLIATCAGLPHFLSRLDFWGEFIDLLGLTILLSNDIRLLNFLRKLLMRIPTLQRLTTLGKVIHPKVVDFIRSFPPAQHAERLETLHGADAEAFLGLFPNQTDEEQLTDVDICVVNFSAAVMNPTVWIFAAVASKDELKQDQKPAAGPVPYSMFADQIERQQHNFIYTAGFLLMAFGSLLCLLHVALNRSQ